MLYFILPTLKMKKLRLREVKRFAQCHTARIWVCQTPNRCSYYVAFLEKKLERCEMGQD